MTHGSPSRPTACILAVAVAVALLAGLVPLNHSGTDTSVFAARARAAQRFTETLYVVDTARYKQHSQVLAVNATSGTVIRRFPAGHQPDAILSPDGTRLYVTSSEWVDTSSSWAHTLHTYDTKSGALLTSVETPDRLLVTLDRYGSRLTMSPSGRFIYILNNHQRPHDEFYLAFFDTTRNALLKGRVELFGCGDAVVVPSISDYKLHVLCGHAATVRQIALRQSGEEVDDTRVMIRHREPYRPGLVLSDPVTDTLTLVGQDWTQIRVDMRSRKVSPEPATAPAPGPTAFGARSDRWLRTERAVRSGPAVFIATGSKVVLKSGSYSLDQIEKLNAVSLKSEGVLKLTTPIYSMVRSADGRSIYGVSPDTATIIAIDTGTLKEIRRLRIPAESPIFAIVSPEQAR